MQSNRTLPFEGTNLSPANSCTCVLQQSKGLCLNSKGSSEERKYLSDETNPGGAPAMMQLSLYHHAMGRALQAAGSIMPSQRGCSYPCPFGTQHGNVTQAVVQPCVIVGGHHCRVNCVSVYLYLLMQCCE